MASRSTGDTSKTNFAGKVDTYQEALMSLFSGKPENTEEDLSKLFTPTFPLRDDDVTRDLAAFVAHIRWLRKTLPTVTLTVSQFLREGAQLAERHMSSTTLPDGTVKRVETFQFAEVAEYGRLAWFVETVKQLD